MRESIKIIVLCVLVVIAVLLDGRTSRAVLESYQSGDPADALIQNAGYIADTFQIDNRTLVYTHGDGSMFGIRPTKVPTTTAVWGARFGKDSAIAIARVK